MQIYNMQIYICKYTYANIQYANIHMQIYICKYTICKYTYANIHMQIYNYYLI